LRASRAKFPTCCLDPQFLTLNAPQTSQLCFLQQPQAHVWLTATGRPSVVPPAVLPDAWFAWLTSDTDSSHFETRVLTQLRAAGCEVAAPFELQGLPLKADIAVTRLGPRLAAAVARCLVEMGESEAGARAVVERLEAAEVGEKSGNEGGSEEGGEGEEARRPVAVIEVDGPRHFARNAR
jgi:hypothetical protein